MATLKALSRVESVIIRNVTATIKTNISRFSVGKVSVYKQKTVHPKCSMILNVSVLLFLPHFPIQGEDGGADRKEAYK